MGFSSPQEVHILDLTLKWQKLRREVHCPPEVLNFESTVHLKSSGYPKFGVSCLGAGVDSQVAVSVPHLAQRMIIWPDTRCVQRASIGHESVCRLM